MHGMKTTIYLSPGIKKALEYKHAETGRSLSSLIEDAVREDLREDAIDLEAISKRRHGATISYEKVLESLKRDGKI